VRLLLPIAAVLGAVWLAPGLVDAREPVRVRLCDLPPNDSAAIVVSMDAALVARMPSARIVDCGADGRLVGRFVERGGGVAFELREVGGRTVIKPVHGPFERDALLRSLRARAGAEATVYVVVAAVLDQLTGAAPVPTGSPGSQSGTPRPATAGRPAGTRPRSSAAPPSAPDPPDTAPAPPPAPPPPPEPQPAAAVGPPAPPDLPSPLAEVAATTPPPAAAAPAWWRPVRVEVLTGMRLQAAAAARPDLLGVVRVGPLVLEAGGQPEGDVTVDGRRLAMRRVFGGLGFVPLAGRGARLGGAVGAHAGVEWTELRRLDVADASPRGAWSGAFGAAAQADLQLGVGLSLGARLDLILRAPAQQVEIAGGSEVETGLVALRGGIVVGWSIP
jgi:hypothetical protein